MRDVQRPVVTNDPSADSDLEKAPLDHQENSGALEGLPANDESIRNSQFPQREAETHHTFFDSPLFFATSGRASEGAANEIIDAFIKDQSGAPIGITSLLGWAVGHGAPESVVNKLVDYVLENRPPSRVSISTVLSHAILFSGPEAATNKLLDFVLTHPTESEGEIGGILIDALARRAPESVVTKLVDYVVEHPPEFFEEILTNAITFGASDSTLRKLSGLGGAE